MQRIQFYKLPISKPDFIQTIIPTLKNSLSLALKHYIPLAGNVVCPLNSEGYPELRYVTGDSVSVIFSESNMDFNCLIGNHPRNAKDFYPFVPQIAEAKRAQGVVLAPLLAIKVTLFPSYGISIGFTHHHVVGDGASIAGFQKTWALLNKFGGNEQFLADGLIPFYDRSLIKDPHGQGVSIWDDMKHKLDMSTIIVTPPPPDKVRGTFIIGWDDITRLKKLILSRRSNLTHITSFTVTCAYVWTCLIKSDVVTGEEIDENRTEFFLCVADCRSRLNPPLPQSYFGNCLVSVITKASRVNLTRKEGFTIAAELIGETIQKRMKDEEWIVKCECIRELRNVDLNLTLSVSGSPKLDLCAVDFGWGRPEKVEFLSIDNAKGVSMSVSKYKDSDKDLEVGLSLPKTQMSAFAAIFTHGLSFLAMKKDKELKLREVNEKKNKKLSTTRILRESTIRVIQKMRKSKAKEKNTRRSVKTTGRVRNKKEGQKVTENRQEKQKDTQQNNYTKMKEQHQNVKDPNDKGFQRQLTHETTK
ncbi:CDK-activating kinase assembly factor mat1 [Datura stramonium]|uniref:CDK-activating kinase assembly factor mat1 n=1 Tax=Datura stramonium TaxID=4076 RepID=A0ABS8Y555_DATST|nr:CDK-activating kinase assembly factor mat1 [Datura stramonium]